VTPGKGNGKRNGNNKKRKATKISPLTSLYLDNFSKADLRRWIKISADLKQFHYQFYYSLQALRTTHYDELCGALRMSSSAVYCLDNWVRIVDHQYTLEPLSSKGSLKWLGGRFNIGCDVDPTQFTSFNGFYIAENEETAYREKFGLKKSDVSNGLSSDELALRKANSYSVFYMSGKVHDLFDLTNSKNLDDFVKIIKQFKISDEVTNLAIKLGMREPIRTVKSSDQLHASLLADDWRKLPAQFDIPSNTQVFGKILADSGFEGVLYPSAKENKFKCLALFPQNFKNTESYIQLSGNIAQDVELRSLSRHTWEQLI